MKNVISLLSLLCFSASIVSMDKSPNTNYTFPVGLIDEDTKLIKENYEFLEIFSSSEDITINNLKELIFITTNKKVKKVTVLSLENVISNEKNINIPAYLSTLDKFGIGKN